MSTASFADRTFRIRFDNGTVYENTYSSDGSRLHYETVEGPMTGKSEDVVLHTAELGEQTYLVNWVESDGTSVTHVMNLATGRVDAFWTYSDGSARVGELHAATLESV